MKKTKRIAGLFASFLLLNTSVFSQCCPYIYGVQVEPANPQSTDEILVFTQVAPPNLGSLISHDFFLQNDTLFINACYYSGLLTVVLEIPDTIHVGQLPDGDYVLSFTASQSNNESVCIVASSQNAISYFTVGSGAALPEIDLSTNLIYPNPAQTKLTVSDIKDDTQLEVYDLKGSLIKVPILFSNGNALIDVSELSAGWYNLVTTSVNKTPTHYFFCKE